MQPGESSELETPVPRFIFLLGWALYLPLPLLSYQVHVPWRGYVGVAALGMLVGAVVFCVFTIKKFWATVPTITEVLPPSSVASTTAGSPSPRQRGVGRPVPGSKPEHGEQLPTGDPRKQRPEYLHAQARFRQQSAKEASLTQRSLVSGLRTVSRGALGAHAGGAAEEGGLDSPRLPTALGNTATGSGPARTPRRTGRGDAVASSSPSSSVLASATRRSASKSSLPLPVPMAAIAQELGVDAAEDVEMATLGPVSVVWKRRFPPHLACLKTANMLLLEGPGFMLMVAIVFLLAGSSGVGAYAYTFSSRGRLPLKAAYWGASAFVFAGTLLFAFAYAYCREAGLRVTESKHARSERKRRGRDAQFDFRGRRRRCRDVSPAWRRAYRALRTLFSGNFTGFLAGWLLLRGAGVGIGLCVGYLGALGFGVGGLVGCVLLSYSWVVSSHTASAIVVACVSTLALLCVCPTLWYCYCSRSSRAAVELSRSGTGTLQNDFAWKDRLQEIFFKTAQSPGDMPAVAKLAAMSREITLIPPRSNTTVDSSKAYQFLRNRSGRIVMEPIPEPVTPAVIRNPLPALPWAV